MEDVQIDICIEKHIKDGETERKTDIQTAYMDVQTDIWIYKQMKRWRDR
jgi:hypothetical protein